MIRPATDSDRPRIRTLQQLLRSPAPDLLELALDGAGTVLVAEDEGEVIAYALAMPGDGDSEPSVVYLAEIVVAPGVRREGHGSRLLDALCDRFPAYDQLRLTARADDADALSFYRGVGFWVLSELPDHYADGDGVLLGKELQA
ncbi:GNAT family N-acetyltransferase [Natronomonas sp. EA1]|uniref:GNAT family N-acetyltransferase n=1 Tax=Natronomonas sp. EA1 TaxID=3421655 RepID=UPI003EB6B883